MYSRLGRCTVGWADVQKVGQMYSRLGRRLGRCTVGWAEGRADVQ